MSKKTPMPENTTTTTNIDPFADRESKNYDNPVPSREFILSFASNSDDKRGYGIMFHSMKMDINLRLF